MELTTKDIRVIREKEWYRVEKGISIDKEVIRESVMALHPTRCPVCRGELSNKDNFGTPLDVKIGEFSRIEAYCPHDNYIILMTSHRYRGNTSGTTITMEIYANAKHSKPLADSGLLADISKGVELHLF